MKAENEAARSSRIALDEGDGTGRHEGMRNRMEMLLALRHQKQHVTRFNRDWRFVGNDAQQPPPGDWRNWLLIGGRGSGKTRAGAEWVHRIASSGDRSDLRIALVAETLGDAREVMIDGVSGICRIARRKRPDFEASRRRLVWPNGAMAQIFSSEDPESLRGPQFHFAWADELHMCFVSEFLLACKACFFCSKTDTWMHFSLALMLNWKYSCLRTNANRS